MSDSKFAITNSDGSPRFATEEDIVAWVKTLNATGDDGKLECARYIRKVLALPSHPPIGFIVKTGVVPTFVALLKTSDNILLQIECSWALSNIATSPAGLPSVVHAGAVSVFVWIVTSGIHEMLVEQCLWGLGIIAEDSPQNRDLILQSPAVIDVICDYLLKSTNSKIRENSAWTLSNFARGKPMSQLVRCQRHV